MTPIIEGSDFDSVLADGTLTLIVRAAFEETPKGTMTRPSYAVEANYPAWLWPPNELLLWCKAWRAVQLAHWNDKFFLVPSSTHTSSIFDIRSRASGARDIEGKLKCRLELLVRGVDAGYRDPPHLRARVDYLPEGQHNRSCNAIGGRENPQDYDSFLDVDDVESVSVPGTRQVQAIHEFGHHLGLYHRGHGTDNPYCQGQASERLEDAMASSDGVRPWHAEPWIRRLIRHQHRPRDTWWVILRTGEESEHGVQPGAHNNAFEQQQTLRNEAGLTTDDTLEIVAVVAVAAVVIGAAVAAGFAIDAIVKEANGGGDGASEDEEDAPDGDP